MFVQSQQFITCFLSCIIPCLHLFVAWRRTLLSLLPPTGLFVVELVGCARKFLLISLGRAFMPLASCHIGDMLPVFAPIVGPQFALHTFWLHRHWKTHRRALGFWPNSYRLIQCAWESHRGLGTAPYWEDAAIDKHLWKQFANRWLDAKQLQPLIYYPILQDVDLQGRSLLQIGEKFTLLPFRHVPVEAAYETSFRFIPEARVFDNERAIQVCSDGSSKNKKGALAVAFLAPYAPIHEAVLAQAAISGVCTSTRAEIRAAVQALRMIRSAIPFLFDMPIVFMTDSAFVLQVLDECVTFKSHPHDLHELLSLWKQVCARVTAQHVKGHAGHPLNTITDHAAKTALCFTHNRILYRTVDYRKVFLTSPFHDLPDFHTWLG